MWNSRSFLSLSLPCPPTPILSQMSVLLTFCKMSFCYTLFSNIQHVNNLCFQYVKWLVINYCHESYRKEKDIFSTKFTMQHKMDRWCAQSICWNSPTSVHWKKTRWQIRQQLLSKTFSNCIQPERSRKLLPTKTSHS